MLWRSTTFRFAALVFLLQIAAAATLLAAIRIVVLRQVSAGAAEAGEVLRQDLLAVRAAGGDAELARAIALEPDMGMYDEPFTGPDPISMGVLIRLIRGLNKALGLTSVIVSHDVEEVLSISDYAYVVAGGKVLDHGEPAAIRNSQSPLVQQFLKGEPDGPIAFHYKSARSYADELKDVVA